MKRLVVVADNSLIVAAVQRGLRTNGEFNLLGHANGRTTSAKTIIDAAPDVVLVDDMDHSELTVSLIGAIAAGNPAITVVVLTVRMDADWLDRVFDAGASGAISKAIKPVALSTVLRETIDGHVVHVGSRPRVRGSRAGAAIGGRGLRAHAVATEDCPLTRRELEILQLVAAGSTNGEIARRLWVTEQTIKFHLSNIYRKLEVGNRTQASHYAHINGLVADDDLRAPVPVPLRVAEAS